MPHVAYNYRELIGSSIGNGQCVALVRECAGLPPTASWRRGDPVRRAGIREAKLEPGTCIATFDPDGRYGNHTDGRSHAAILLYEEDGGLRVIDQWVGRKPLPGVQERLIRFKGGDPTHVDDGDCYYVIELQPL